MRGLGIGAAILAAVVAAGAPQARAADRDAERVEREIARLAAAAGGRVGVAAVHLESGRRLAVAADERFPMASTYKVAIALRILRMVDAGELALDRPVLLTVADYRPAWSPLAEFAAGTPMTVTVGRLLRLMLSDSDNSASDALMKLAGGPAAVTARLRELGVSDVRVDRYEAQFFLDGTGVKDQPPPSEWSAGNLEALADKVPHEETLAAEARYADDPRDTASPAGMAGLLGKLYRGEALSPESTRLAISLMEGATTAADRIKGRLPEGTVVAHKSGTQAGTANDVGIVTLPGGAGHVVVAIYVRGSDKPTEARAKAIAEIARTVYDYYLLSDATSPTSPARP